MIRRDGDRMFVSGDVTLRNVTGLLHEGIALVREGEWPWNPKLER